MSVDKRNLNSDFAVDGIGGSPTNGSFSMASANVYRIPISETRPVSKACQRVTRASTQTFPLVSSAFALHHESRSGPCSIVRGREVLNSSQYIVGVGQCRTGEFAT